MPLINAKISSFNTRPSLPVEGTFEMSIPCLLAILRTAGVANALLLDSSTFASSFVLPTGYPSSEDDDEELVSSVFLAAVVGVVSFPSSTSISIKA